MVRMSDIVRGIVREQSADAAKDSVYRQKPTRLDCLTHPDERNAQC